MVVYIGNANFILPERVAEGGMDLGYWDLIAFILDILTILFVSRYSYREFRQMWAFGFNEYFLSLWNYIDILLVIMVACVMTLDIMACVHYYVAFNVLKILHAYTIFVMFIRLISFYRGIQGTSFMIRLVIQVIIDIQSFLILMMLFIIGLACSSKL